MSRAADLRLPDGRLLTLEWRDHGDEVWVLVDGACVLGLPSIAAGALADGLHRACVDLARTRPNTTAALEERCALAREWAELQDKESGGCDG